MRKLNTRFFTSFFLAFILLSVSFIGAAYCEDKYPSRAIDLLVPFRAGGMTDLAARVWSKHLSNEFGVPVNVINKPGANTVPCTLELMKAKTDGYTILMDNQTAIMLPVVVKDLPFNIMDRTWMCTVGISPFALIVPADSPFQNFGDIVAAIKKDPERIRWPSLGGVGAQDYFTRQILAAIDVDISKPRRIKAKGGAGVMILTAQGSVDFGSGSVSVCKATMAAGKIRPIAVTGDTRHQDIPDVPTFKELGYPQIDCAYWVGYSGPPNLPSNIVDVWIRTCQKLLKDPTVLADLKKIGVTPLWRDQAQTIKRVKIENEETKKLWALEKK